MKRRLICTIVLLAMLVFSALTFSSCDSGKPPKCVHNWANATCAEPKTCTLCKAIDGEALGHTWVDADCVTPKTCSVCATTEGEALGHTWVDADCVTPKTCSVCATTEGEALGHTWVDADCVTPKTCSVCATTEGEDLGHTWVDADCVTPKTCSVCAKTEGNALGHTWLDADCVTPQTCSACQAIIGAPLGHKWEDANCESPKTCSSCAAIEGEALGHDYTESISTEATCSTEGLKLFECTRCENEYTESYTFPTYSAVEIHNMTETSVGEIVTYDKSGKGLALGTCFVYSSDGKIITNYHVIEDAYSADITINGKTYAVKKVLAYDKEIDIAVLKINATGLDAVTLCSSEHKIGSTVYAFGSSKGLTATFSQGIITSNRELDGVVYVQHDAAISSGNSGGPLINEHGEVIGINTMTIKDSQNLNFAINVSELDNLEYGNPLTMSEFYNAEFNPYEVLKEWVLENYNNTGDTFVSFDYKTSGKNHYILGIAYYFESDFLSISSYFVFDNNDACFISIDLSEDPTQCWYMASYTDGDYGYQNIVKGYINATTFTSSSTLKYYSYDGDYWTKTSILDIYQEVAVNVVDWFEWCLDHYNIGITLSDFGFVKF